MDFLKTYRSTDEKWRFLRFIDFLYASPGDLEKEFDESLGARSKLREEDLSKLQKELLQTLEIIYDHMAFNLARNEEYYKPYRKIRWLKVEESAKRPPSEIIFKGDLKNAYREAKNKILKKLNSDDLDIDERDKSYEGSQVCLVYKSPERSVWYALTRFLEGYYLEWIAKLGRCPHCERFFQKKRSDQIYCSEQHRLDALAKQRREEQ